MPPLARFLIIVSLLFLYTGYKANQLWPAHRVLTALLTLLLFGIMLGGTFFYRTNPLVFNAIWFRVIVWSGAIAMGFWATFVLLSLPFDIMHALMNAYHRIVDGVAFSDERRTFFRGLSVSIFGLSGGLAAVGLFQAYRGPDVKRAVVPRKVKHPGLAGLKIAQISDLHIGPTLRRGYVADVVQRTNALSPDLIFITGDLADAHASSLTEHLEPLGTLQARHGVFYVTGNHEYYWGAADLVAALTTLGITPLLNENRVLSIGEARVLVAGVTDPTGERVPGHAPDLEKALREPSPVDYKILLAHRPHISIEAERLGADLQFSGHTHSGQFFPFSLLIGIAHQYSAGLYQRGNLSVYVNRGTGYWGPANRFGVPSEISEITLT